MDKEYNKEYNKDNKEKLLEYDSDEELYINNDKNYNYNNPLIEKNLEECYLEINENNRENNSRILEKWTLTSFENFIKKHSYS